MLCYYITGAPPTWEDAMFFQPIWHLCMIMKVALKTVLTDKRRLHPMVSGPPVVVSVLVTGV
ncbi:hypothetical protein Pint_04018 [Pistacia integerrima]|uniref:Uncharacterized protein n=1 Tax=Pistacia integerrima TaxID=434235 RepID=A0ACC0Z794_9ROSI|nr:hypothetical protein Pint_04018 [Pistacia integerrima]